MARFFIPPHSARDGRAKLTGPELHHLRDVLRLGRGDHVTLFDGAGREFRGRIERISPAEADIAVVEVERPREPALRLALAAGLLKGRRTDLVIEKATELGVSRIIPLRSARTVPAADASREDARLARWRRVALSAAKQCGRSELPSVEAPIRLAELAARIPREAARLLLWEGERRTFLEDAARALPSAQDLVVVVGPEGGFSDEEIAFARDEGFRVVGLGGGRVLRSETAAIVAAALCQFLWGDLGRSPRREPAGR